MQNDPNNAAPVRRDVPTSYPGVRQRCDNKTGDPIPGKFELIYTDSAKKQRRKTALATSASGAAKERANIISKELRGERILSRDDETRTFRDVAETWFAEQRTRPRTQQLNRYCLDNLILPTFGDKQLVKITTDDVAAFIRDLERNGSPVATRQKRRPLSAVTINKAVGIVGLVYKLAMRRYGVPHNPVAGLTRGERPTPTAREKFIFSDDDLRSLLEAATPHWRVLWMVMAYSGLRISEALGLRWCDVDFKNSVIHVRHQLGKAEKGGPRVLVPTKTSNSSADVNLIPELAFALRSWRNTQGIVAPNELVFTIGRASRADLGHIGREMKNAQQAFDRAIKVADLPDDGRRKPTPHDLRHTFASFLLKQTGDVAYVARQLRKSVSDTLHTYADVYDPAESAGRAEKALSARWEKSVSGL
jgi:integrase